MWHLLPLAPNGCLAVRFSTILRQPFVAERCIYRILTTKWGGALMYVAPCVGSSLTTLHRCAKGIRASSSCRLTFESYSGHKIEDGSFAILFLLFSVMLVWRDVSRSYCDCEVQKHCLSEQAPQSIFLTFIASNSHRSVPRIALLTERRLRGYMILLLGLCPAHRVSARAQAIA